MTTEEIIRVINNSDIKSVTDFINRAPRVFPEISNIVILDRVDLGLNGILTTAKFNNGDDEVIIKGFLYMKENWSPDTHGYVIAKKI